MSIALIVASTLPLQATGPKELPAFRGHLFQKWIEHSLTGERLYLK